MAADSSPAVRGSQGPDSEDRAWEGEGWEEAFTRDTPARCTRMGTHCTHVCHHMCGHLVQAITYVCAFFQTHTQAHTTSYRCTHMICAHCHPT